MHLNCKSNVLLCFPSPRLSLSLHNSGHTSLKRFGESDDKSHSALNGGGMKSGVVGRGVVGALKGDDRREMQIFPLCLFVSIWWIYVAFLIMK